MYAYIQGEITEIYGDRAVVEAAGVGYELFCSANTLNRLQKGKKARLITHLHLAEDIMALYGFYEEEERLMFRRLLSVTRVGPKLALGVLSHLSPSDVAAAIVTDNAAALSKVPGMGKKTAQRVLLELRGKVETGEMISSGLAEAVPGQNDMRAEAVAALVALGYDGATAQRAVMSVKEAGTVEGLITDSLRRLAKA